MDDTGDVRYRWRLHLALAMGGGVVAACLVVLVRVPRGRVVSCAGGTTDSPCRDYFQRMGDLGLMWTLAGFVTGVVVAGRGLAPVMRMRQQWQSSARAVRSLVAAQPIGRRDGAGWTTSRHAEAHDAALESAWGRWWVLRRE